MIKTAKHWPALLGLIVGLYFFVLPVVGKLESFPGDLGDSRFNNYLIEHAHQYLIGERASYWNAPFMHPEVDVISYSDNLLGAAPLYSISRFLGFDREASWSLWYVLLTILNFLCAYLFLFYLFKNPYAATLGAFVFAFSIALQAQIGHAQTFPRFPIPLAIWAGLRFREKRKIKFFALSMVCLVHQFYCAIYLGLMLSFPLAIFYLWDIILDLKTWRLKIKDYKWGLGIVFSIGGALLLLAPLMIPYLERSKKVGLYSYESIFHALPTFKSYLFCNDGSYMWKDLSLLAIDYPAYWDHLLFPGLFALLGSVAFIFLFAFKVIKTERRTDFTILLATALVTFFFFLRIGDFSLFKIIYNLPGFGSLRALQRIINVELLFMSIAVSFVLLPLLKEKASTVIPTFLILLIALSIDNYQRPDKILKSKISASDSRVDPIIEKLKDVPRGSIISYETDHLEGRSVQFQADAMLASQSLNLICINGYSATSPHGYGLFWDEANDSSRNIWFNTKNYKPDTLYVAKDKSDLIEVVTY